MIDRPGLTGVLHELNDEARVLVQNSPDIMLRLNLDGTIGWVNPAWMRWLGYSIAEVKDQPFVNFVHPDDLRLLSKAVQHLHHEDLTQRTRFRLLRKGGSELEVGVRGTYFNGLGRAYLVLRDQSMALAFEQKILLDRQRFERLLRYSMIGVSLLDAKGVILYQSPTSVDLLGYEPAELVGRNAFEFAHPDERDTQLHIFTKLLAEPGSNRRSPARWRKKSGQYARLIVHAWNLLADEVVQAIVVNFWDVDKPLGFE
jgi:PAS domain S-box-containing protein